ncbi:MAG: nitroreductase family protein [Tannerellaceae bacterium]|jgi:nitroreductase|nr:nitroreductase family protein [Tannerellaceae bacterium]
MNTLELIRKRCSIRQYSSAPIEAEKVEYLLEAARLAPSACNNQPWYFLVVTEEEGRLKIQLSYSREWVKSVPLFIVLCGDHGQSWRRPADGKDHLDLDAGIAIEHICLAAAEQDLGSCIICHFDVPLMHAAFHLPEQIEPLAIISLGYPERPELFAQTPKRRKPAEEVVRWERFSAGS